MAGVGVGANRLIGRDRELATLGSFLGEAVGNGATLLLTGEPGVGKTALLAAAAEMATTISAVSPGPVVRRSRLRSASARARRRTASRC